MMGSVFSPTPRATLLSSLMPEINEQAQEELNIDAIISRESKEVRMSVGSPTRPQSKMDAMPLPPAQEEPSSSSSINTDNTDNTSNSSERRYSQAEMDAVQEQLACAAQRADISSSSAAEECARLSSELAQAQAELHALRDAALDAAAARQAEQAALREAQDEAAIARTQAKALAHRLQGVDGEKEEQLRDARSEVATLQAQISELTARHAESFSEHRAVVLQAAKEEREAAVAAHRAEIAALQEVNKKLAAELETVPSQLAAAESKGKQYVYKKVERQFEEGNKEFMRTKKELTDRLSEFSKTFWGLVAGLQAVASSSPSASAPASAGEAEAAAAAADVLSAITALRLKQQEELQQTQTALASKEGEIAGHTTAMAALQEAHSFELSNTKAVLRNTVATLEGELQRSEGDLSQLRSDHASALSQLSSAQDELKECKAELDAQMCACAKMMTTQAALEAKAETAANTAAAAVAAAEAEASRLRIECEEKEARCVQLRSMNEEVMQMLESAYASKDGQGQA